MAMAAPIWRTARRIDETLFERPQHFEFFQAVRLLALIVEESAEAGAPAAFRLGVEPALAFPASSIVRLQHDSQHKDAVMTVSFFGLLGPLGTLPQLYTEQAIHQRFAGDASYAAFFDIFHDRLLRLFYRAWSKPRLYLAYDRPRLPHAERHPLARYLFALIGMGTPGLEERLPFRDEALLRYPGLLAQRPRSAECLRAMLEDFFGVPVRVEQFVGRWHSLEPEECCALGMGETNAQLGLGCVAGDAVWTRSAMVRIALGPLTAKQFHSFLPDADGFATITGLTRWFLGQGLSFALQPALAAGQTPEWMELANDGDAGPRLGWNTWLSEEAFATPALDAVFGEEESLEGIRTWH